MKRELHYKQNISILWLSKICKRWHKCC